MGNVLPELGDLLFSLVVGYIGALELLYVVRHLYHWTCGHARVDQSDDEVNSLQLMEDELKERLSEAEQREVAAGAKLMVDGVPYKDGFRIEPRQPEIEELRAIVRGERQMDDRRRTLEAELAEQRRVEEETRALLERAEAELARQRKETAETEAREQAEKLLAAEREREAEQKRIEEEQQQENEERERLKRQVEEEEKENERRLLEAERQREEEQQRKEEEKERENERRLLEAERLHEEERRRIEEEEENARKILEAERQREEEEERIENEKRLFEAEKQREEEQRRIEEEEERIENEKRFFEAEKQREEKQRRIEEEEEERDNERRLLESKKQQDDQQQRQIQQEEEAAKKLIEAEKQREEQQRSQEEEEENSKKLIEAEKEHEEEQRKKEETAEEEENTSKLLQAEKQLEDKQRQQEDEEVVAVKSERKLIVAENRLENQQNDNVNDEYADEKEEEEENERRIFEAERAREEEQRRIEEEQERADEEIVFRLLEAESQRLALEEAAIEAENHKQRMCKENERLCMEAEEKIIKLQHQISEGAISREFLDDLEIEPVVEEPCVRKKVERKFAPPEEEIEDEKENSGNNDENIEVEPPCERKTQTVKTQFGQASSEPFSVSSKPLLFPGLSDDGSSIEPNSSKQSSFSTQPSEDASTTVTDELSSVKVQYPANERQEPDGEDNAPLVAQYSEEYLRSLDGLNRPLVREDGSGRRRAFKKRRSGSNSSNSSRDSRTSREEEVKMFTSLEEDEMHKPEQDGNTDYTPIKYNSDPGMLKVKHGHHRRHKRRSPAKDAIVPNTGEQTTTNNGRGSLEMLGEESTDPWGETVPAPYKNTDFWKREKTVSIDEENADADDAVHTEATKTETNEAETDDDHQHHKDTATNIPKKSSFEDATPTQNEQAITAMKRKLSKDVGDNESNIDGAVQQNETNTNFKASHSVSPARSSGLSLHLRRSPRIAAMEQYEESFKRSATVPNTPTITVDSAPWRDEHGLMLEGLSDFYDFSASVNRSRNASRNASPANSAPNTPLPKDVNYTADMEFVASSVDVYDDTGIIAENEFTPINIESFITNVMGNEETIASNNEMKLQNVSDDAGRIIENEKLSLVPTVCINAAQPDGASIPDEEQQMDTLLQTLRTQRISDRSRSCSRSRSHSPLPTPENMQRSLESRRAKLIKHNDDVFEKINSRSPSPESPMEEDVTHDCSRESMNALVATLRAERSRSRSRSRSPLPSANQLERSLETRRQKRIQHNDEYLERLTEQPITQYNAPSISIEYADGDDEGRTGEEEDCSREQMSQLVESLRIARSRSRSKTPARMSAFEGDGEEAEMIERFERARTPSRSLSQSPPSRSNSTIEVDIEDDDFHELLNLEASNNRTLDKNSEEAESLLAAKQRRIDIEALHALRNAHEEMELRTVTPLDVLALPSSTAAADIDAQMKADAEGDDQLSELSTSERLHQLRCSPTTPNYERSISDEWRDVQRIRAEQLASGFKRSTYVGESLDLGSEFEGLRRETAAFQRSRTPSPSFSRVESECVAGGISVALEKRQLQAEILAELAAATGDVDVNVDEDVDLDELRREAVKFRRSRSNSRSPLNAADMQEIAQIEAEAAKRELQDKILDQLASGAGNFQRLSRHLNVNFLESERRASDSLLLRRDDDDDVDAEMAEEPEEYHHFRRFSLAQDQPIEEYPEDDDYDDLHSWASDDYEIDINENDDVVEDAAEESFVNFELNEEGEVRELADDEIASDDDSDDERQTVVDVDDEIDEDICDFVERGVTDESHHEQSECEEAERELDLYAGRDVHDWEEVHDVAELLLNAEADAEAVNVDGGAGADGGDSDSVTIDQIYDEAIRHRKQSGILRDYDSILRDMQNSYMDRNTGGSSNAGSESEGGRHGGDGKRSQVHDVTNDGGGKRAHEIRYLGDANSTARKSTRLRSRYGYVPQLQAAAATTVDELEGVVDVNYVPRREYNWRKNFRLDDDEEHKDDNRTENHTEEAEERENQTELLASEDLDYETMGVDMLDLRKYSLGGESITLFSRSRNSIECEYTTIDEGENATNYAEHEPSTATAAANDTYSEEKPKKKKSKKKLRKDTKLKKQITDELNRDDDDSESQIYSRRSSSLQLDGPIVDSPKTRKSRSRRSSKSSLTNDDSFGNYVESPLGDISEVFGEALLKKKTIKKRKKSIKDAIKPANDISEDIVTTATELESKFEPISTVISPESASANALASLSPALSVCVTPTSTKSLHLDTTIKSISPSMPTTPTTATTTKLNTTISASAPATTLNTPVETFDILKDANFYPLF